MKNAFACLGVALVACLLFTLIGVGTADDEFVVDNTKQVNNEARAYQEVLNISGSGLKTTEPFMITGDRIRINYRAVAGNFGSCYFGVMAYEVGGESWDLRVAVNEIVELVAEDQTTVYLTGEQYLEINSSCDEWTVIVSDFAEV